MGLPEKGGGEHDGLWAQVLGTLALAASWFLREDEGTWKGPNGLAAFMSICGMVAWGFAAAQVGGIRLSRYFFVMAAAMTVMTLLLWVRSSRPPGGRPSGGKHRASTATPEPISSDAE